MLYIRQQSHQQLVLEFLNYVFSMNLDVACHTYSRPQYWTHHIKSNRLASLFLAENKYYWVFME